MAPCVPLLEEYRSWCHHAYASWEKICYPGSIVVRLWASFSSRLWPWGRQPRSKELAPAVSPRRDEAPASLWPPGSSPGWWLEAAGETTPPVSARPPARRRAPLLALALGLVAAAPLAGAVAAKALSVQPSEPAQARPLATGITLRDVSVDGHRRLAMEASSFEGNHRGYNECYQPDPLGLGPYAPYLKTRGLIPGRIAIPQQGGHTADMGFDVVVHFHGGEAVRKTFVQVVSGVVFVAVDLGLGSGAYSRGFGDPGRWPRFKAEIGRALREHTGDDRAHIRHLALTSWSAGYGAVNQILKQHGDRGIDAVVLLDSMHVGQNYAWPRRDGSLQSLSAEPLRALFDFAAKAVEGEKIFVLTHSNIVPPDYASSRQSADLLLHELKLKRSPQERRVGFMDQLTTVDQGHFHVWGYAGRYEKAHCAHTTLLGPIVHDLLESVWETPPMDRDVPPTPAPVQGGR